MNALCCDYCPLQHCSNNAICRAKETAAIISKHLPEAHRTEPDSLLEEGRPAHSIPTRKYDPKRNKDHTRIEQAFSKYFQRVVDSPSENQTHEYEVHAPCCSCIAVCGSSVACVVINSLPWWCSAGDCLSWQRDSVTQNHCIS